MYVGARISQRGRSGKGMPMESHFAGGSSPKDRNRAAFAPDRPLIERWSALTAGGVPVAGGAPTVPRVRFGIQRARDLLVLDVEARGMVLKTATGGDPVLEVAAGQEDGARLIVSFPPQHIGERAWPESP